MPQELADANYFEKQYRDYERQNPPRKLQYYIEFISSLTPGAGERRLLDIGCGLGAFLGHASGAGFAENWGFFGTDLRADAARSASLRTDLNIPTVASDATAIPFRSESFDVVTAFDVLEHVPDRDLAASEILRVLRPDGILVFVVPVYDGVTGLVVRALDKDPTHVNKLSRSDWLQWSEQRFDTQRWVGILRFLVPMGPYLHFAGPALKKVRSAIIVGARKPAGG